MNESFPLEHVERLIARDTDTVGDTARMSLPIDIPVNEQGEQIINPAEALTAVFKQESGKPFEGMEIEKTERDIEIINLAKGFVVEQAKLYGRTDFIDIPLPNIHFLKSGSVEEITGGTYRKGFSSSVLGQILVDRNSDVDTALTVFHELWHNTGAYNAAQVTTKGAFSLYRSGLIMRSRDGGDIHYVATEEALVALMTQRFFDTALKGNSDFKEGFEDLEKRGEGVEAVDPTMIGYFEKFRKFVDEIYEKSNGKFALREDVINLFLRSSVTGNVMELARTIDDIFGPGSFRNMENLI